MDTVPLYVRDWASATNATIVLMKWAHVHEDVATALMTSILMSNLASADRGTLEHVPLDFVPEELKAPLLKWWDTPPPETDMPTLADTTPAALQLYDDWVPVYERWRKQQRQEIA